MSKQQPTKSFKGLKMIISHHRIFGITYMGECFDEKSPFVKKALLIIWNIILLLLMIYFLMASFVYMDIVNINMKKSANVSEQNRGYSGVQRKSFVAILYNVGILSYGTLTVIICLFLMIRGRKILGSIINNNIIDVGEEFESKLGLIYSIIRIAFEILFPPTCGTLCPGSIFIPISIIYPNLYSLPLYSYCRVLITRLFYR